MFRYTLFSRLSAIVVASLALAACGGGAGNSFPFTDPQTEANAGFVQTALTPNVAPIAPSAAAALVDAENLFDSMEQSHPDDFSPPALTQRHGIYAYRHYSNTGTYLTVDGDQVQVFGPRYGPRAIRIGALSDFACTVFPEACLGARARVTLHADAASAMADAQLGAIGTSSVAAVLAAFPNRTPVAVVTGGNSSVVTGAIVFLSGAQSFDADGDTLNYSWSLAGPLTSHSFISGANGPSASFIPDIAGTYVATLTINDGHTSASSTVSVAATSSSPFCCKHCTTGKPCGDTCISFSNICHVGPGCAC